MECTISDVIDCNEVYLELDSAKSCSMRGSSSFGVKNIPSKEISVSYMLDDYKLLSDTDAVDEHAETYRLPSTEHQ